MEKIQKLKELVLLTEKDAAKFFNKGNRTAGRRARKSMQLLKSVATAFRKDILDGQKAKIKPKQQL